MTLLSVALVGVVIGVRASIGTGGVPGVAGTTSQHALERRAAVSVEGLVCSACVRRLQEHLASLSGVTSAQVDPARRLAIVTVADRAKTSDEQIRAVVRDAGFQPVHIEWGKSVELLPVLAQLVIHGTRAPRCAAKLEQTLQRRRDVRSVTVDFQKDLVTVLYDERHSAEVMKAINDTGIYRTDADCDTEKNSHQTQRKGTIARLKAALTAAAWRPSERPAPK